MHLPKVVIENLGTIREGVKRIPKDELPERILNLDSLENATVSMNSGVIFDQNGILRQDTLYPNNESAARTEREKITNIKEIDAASVAIIPHWRNFFHILTQCAFSMWLIARKFGSEPQFIFPECDPKLKEIVETAIRPKSIMYVHPQTIASVKRLTFIETTYGRYIYEPSPYMVEFGSEIASLLGSRVVPKNERIYISRRDTPHRRVVNEAELEDRLAQEGFSTVLLSKLSFAEQVSLFCSAAFVFAPHGAGLANVIFCRPGTVVAEFCPDAYTNICFATLSQIRGLRHHIYVCPSGQRTSRQQDLQWEAPIEPLLAAVRKIA
jgi:capsular polysaccharide biosynthesis protein